MKWLHNMTSKAAHHIKLQENFIHEWVQDKTLNVVCIEGKNNPGNILTKEIDGAHFCCLRDSFMTRLSDFVNDSLLQLHHSCQRSPPITPTAAFDWFSSCVVQLCTVLSPPKKLSVVPYSTIQLVRNSSSKSLFLQTLVCKKCLFPPLNMMAFCYLLPPIEPW